MDKIDIRLSTPCNNDSVLRIFKNRMVEYDDRIVMDIDRTDVKVGETLTFSRIICGPNGEEKMHLEDNVNILKVIDNESYLTIETEKIPARRLSLKRIDYDYETIEDDGETYTNVLLNEKHTAFPLDLFYINEDQELIFKDIDGEELSGFTVAGISDTLGNMVYDNDGTPTYTGKIKFFDKDTDCLNLIKIDNKNIDPSRQIAVYDSCGIKTYEYIFLPDDVDIHGVILSGFTGKPEGTAYCELKYNPYYFYTINDGKKVCTLYEDFKWEELSEIYDLENRYVNYAVNKNATMAVIRRRYWKTNITLGVDEASNQDTLESGLVEKYENALISTLPIIDMERIRFSPRFQDSDVVPIGIDLIFHLRPREVNTAFTETVYTDRWEPIEKDPDSEGERWNNIDLRSESVHGNPNNTTALKNAGYFNSDLLGYFNFTDKDVYYRKKKVSQTFVRLLFYDSKDPVSQKLLYYSTVFLDSTGLYGKYVKQINNFKTSDNALTGFGENEDYKTISDVVFWENGTRVDSQISVTHEYDRTRSSEGYYLYLFNQDLGVENVNIDENGFLLDGEGKKIEIYLKVEFNHAGNGKTLAFIAPIHSKNTFVETTMDNIYDQLYIPVMLQYKSAEDAFYYVISKEYTYLLDNKIKVVLFEPVLNAYDYSGGDEWYDSSNPDNGGSSGNNTPNN